MCQQHVGYLVPVLFGLMSGRFALSGSRSGRNVEWHRISDIVLLPILLATYVTLVEYIFIIFVNIVSQFQSSTFDHN